ncbi:MAG: glycosyltransferase [Candidatus Brocadiia bacterium]
MSDLEKARTEAESLYADGKLEEALRKYRSLLLKHPGDAGLLNDAGTVCYALGRVEESVDFYRRALALDEDNADVLNNLRSLQEDGRLPEDLREAIADDRHRRGPEPGLRYLHPQEPTAGIEHTRRARIFTDPRCNVRCRFCYYVNSHAEAWPTRLIERQIDFAAEAGMREIDFSGGESSMRRDFVDLVAYARQYGFRSICTLTNGWRFADGDFMRAAVDAGLTEILFSVHGYSRENHDWLTQVDGSYDRILRAIELAHEHGLTVRTNTTVTRENHTRLEDIAETIREKVAPCQSNFILFNEFSEAGQIADRFSVRYSEACPHVKRAVDVLEGVVPYVNVRYVPFCFMDGYERHVCAYSQKIFDPFEWSQRMLALCRRDFIEKPMRYYRHLLSVVERYAQSVRLDPASIPDRMADDAFIARNRDNYVKRESCRNCRYYYICDGVERAYSEHIGLAELQPRPGEKLTNPLEFREDFYDGYERYLPSAAAAETRPVTRNRAATPASGPTISVIIPTYNRSAILAECLGALAQQRMDAKQFEVIIVDDGGADGSERAAAGFGDELSVRYLRQEHAGPAAARNLGVREARGEVVVIINDDAIVRPDFLRRHGELHEVFGGNDRMVVVGNRRFAPADAWRVMNFLFENVPLYTPLQTKERGFCNYKHFITFNLSARRRAFFRYGFFDESFPTPLVEDIELGWRWEMNGARLLFESDILAYHRHDMSVDGWDSHITRLYTNKLIMFEKHPESRPGNYFMNIDEEQMRAFVARSREYMERFRAELAAVENRDVRELTGAEFLGRRLGGPEDFLGVVREMAPHYKRYRSFAHYLEGARAPAERAG